MTSLENDKLDVSTGIRQNLVDTAAEFLNMKNVRPQSQKMKIQFLEKKGLTKAEIDAAFAQSSQFENIGGQNDLVPRQNHPVYMPQMIYPHQNQPSVWSQMSNVVNTVFALTGFAFGLNFVYTKYIGPYLTGVRPKSPEEAAFEVQKSVMGILKQIEVTLERINKNILEHTDRRDDPTLEELKEEMKTIKGLLLNKKSIAPPPPSLSPVLPSWQRIQSTEDQEALKIEEKALFNGSVPGHLEEENKKISTVEDLKFEVHENGTKDSSTEAV